MYREIVGTDERVRAIPGVRDRRVRATEVRLYLSISTASPLLGDYVKVRVSAVLVEEMLLKIKSSHKIC